MTHMKKKSTALPKAYNIATAYVLSNLLKAEIGAAWKGGRDRAPPADITARV